MSYRPFWILALVLLVIELGLFALLSPFGDYPSNEAITLQTRSMSVMAASSVCTLLAALMAGFFAKKASDAAVRQADLMLEARIADHRPWIKTGLHLEDDFEWHPIGGPGVEVGISIENVGKSPALNVHTSIEMLPSFSHANERLMQLAADNEKSDKNNSRLLLPGDKYIRPWIPTIEIGDIKEEDYFCPTIIGCVTYQDADSLKIRQTAFCFVLSNESRVSYEPGNVIPKEKIEVLWWAGGFAT